MGKFAKGKEGLMRAQIFGCVLLLFLAVLPAQNTLQAQSYYGLDDAIFMHGAEAILQFLRDQKYGDDEQMEIRAKMIRFLGNPANKGNEAIKNQLLNTMEEGFSRFAVRNNREFGYWQIRAESALSLARIGDTSVAPAIARLAFLDTNEQVKMCAIRALGILKYDGSVPLLIDMLSLSPIDRLANELVQALGEIGDKRAFPILLSYAMRSTTGTLQRSSLAAVKKIKW